MIAACAWCCPGVVPLRRTSPVGSVALSWADDDDDDDDDDDGGSLRPKSWMVLVMDNAMNSWMFQRRPKKWRPPFR